MVVSRYRSVQCAITGSDEKIELPATIAIKHQLRMLMAQDEAKKAQADARAEASRRQRREELLAK
jgi:hypothetical protein